MYVVIIYDDRFSVQVQEKFKYAQAQTYTYSGPDHLNLRSDPGSLHLHSRVHGPGMCP